MHTITKLTIISILLILLGCHSSQKKEAIETPVFEENWESLSTINKEPEWFKDAKLGIYFTWGPYTVPQFQSEWYPRWMYLTEKAGWNKDAWRFPGSEGWARGIYEFHEKTYGPQTEFNYHDLIPLWKAPEFNAAEWAELFKKSGAKFAGPIAQHHDGFALWDSEVNMWNAKDMGPKIDIVGDLIAELKKQDLKTIATFHHARNLQRYAQDTAMWGGWDSHFPYHPDFATSSTDPKLKYLYGNIPADEFHDYWLEQIREVVEGYHPDLIWFDTWLDLIPEEYRKKMVAMHYNHATAQGQEPIVIFKQEDLPHSVGVQDMEQSGRKEMSKDYWMTDLTLSFNSWSYVEPQTYKPIEMLLRNMIDVWSKKGIVLLNLCPKADGTINKEQRDVLAELGTWLDTYGEAVYGTRTHDIFGYGTADIEAGFEGEGQSATQDYTANDIRFTKSKDGKSLYVFVLGMPAPNTQLELKHVINNNEVIKQITVLNSGRQLNWEANNKMVTLTTPDTELMNEIATVFKVSYQ